MVSMRRKSMTRRQRIHASTAVAQRGEGTRCEVRGASSVSAAAALISKPRRGRGHMGGHMG
eukprot:6431994-Prymnesium_polylepis.1